MNDFTKEELEQLRGAVSDLVVIDGYDSEHSILYRKIQSMIDNYCDHDCKATIWQCQVTACSQCGYPSTLIAKNNE